MMLGTNKGNFDADQQLVTINYSLTNKRHIIMNILKIFSVCLVTALPLIGAETASAADEKATVQTFYDYLSNSGSKASL